MRCYSQSEKSGMLNIAYKACTWLSDFKFEVLIFKSSLSPQKNLIALERNEAKQF